jgi:hypothetical protein
MWLVSDQVLRPALTREEFERVAADYIAHFEALVRAALALANLSPTQVSLIILAGGHSRWYFVDETLKRIFSSVSRNAANLLRHGHPEQSVARGLAYAPMVRAAGARLLAPVRKSAHSLWIQVPNGARVMTRNLTGAESVKQRDRGPGWDEPVLILPRGHELPYRMPRPVQIAVSQLGLDAREASVRIQFYSSAGGSTRMALHERVARFERGLWENMMKRLGACLPWAAGAAADQFELLILCAVDENELLTAELVIVRYFRGKQVAVQRQKLMVSNGSVPDASDSADTRRVPAAASFA